MTTKSKPTILSVPGAWMPSDCFNSLRHLLTQEGSESVTVDHPSVGSESADQTLDDDVANLRNTLDRLIEQEGKDILLLLHSYGGVFGSCASKGLGAEERLNNEKQGGITNMIFVAAFTLRIGESLLDKLGGQMPPYVKLEGLKVKIDQTPETVFPELPEDEQKTWHARLTHTAVGVFAGTSTHEPWHSIPCAYFVCNQDTILLSSFQEALAHSIGATVQKITADHNPFLSVSDQIVKGIKTVVGS